MHVSSLRIARVAEHSFLANPITADSVVLDLGVNTGAFATALVRDYGCTVIGVEPVPHLFSALPELERLTVEQLALTGEGDAVDLYINPSSTAATIDPRLAATDVSAVTVPGITLGALLDRHEVCRAALVKVDIEGAELAMIDSAPRDVLDRVDQFTIEFHDFLDPGMTHDVNRVKRRLQAAGFSELCLSGDNSDVLFVNRTRLPFGPHRRTAAALAYKYPRGAGRKLRRTAARFGVSRGERSG